MSLSNVIRPLDDGPTSMMQICGRRGWPGIRHRQRLSVLSRTLLPAPIGANPSSIQLAWREDSKPTGRSLPSCDRNSTDPSAIAHGDAGRASGNSLSIRSNGPIALGAGPARVMPGKVAATPNRGSPTTSLVSAAPHACIAFERIAVLLCNNWICSSALPLPSASVTQVTKFACMAQSGTPETSSSSRASTARLNNLFWVEVKWRMAASMRFSAS